MRPHFVHLNVQCSKPGLPGATRWISMRAWHSEQRGRLVWRGDSLLLICASGISHSYLVRRGRPKPAVTENRPEGGGPVIGLTIVPNDRPVCSLMYFPARRSDLA